MISSLKVSSRVFIILLLATNVSNVFGKTMKPKVAVKYCLEKYWEDQGPSIVYEKDGHYYTTYFVAKNSNFRTLRAFTLSYYSQYPDIDKSYNAVPVSIKYLLVPWKWKWRNDITGVLHSLHGGGREKIDIRRQSIRRALKNTLNDPNLDWLSGLLIHAFGDSYAHTKRKYNSQKEKAYGVWIGHALANIFGKSPDDLKREGNKRKYKAYVKDLFHTFSEKNIEDFNDDKLNEFIDTLCEEGAECKNFHKLIEQSQNKEVGLMDTVENCINENAIPLSVDEIKQAIDLISIE